MNATSIKLFIDRNQVLDPFAALSVSYNGILFPTAEHAYQAAKFMGTDDDIVSAIAGQSSPYLAKEYAHKSKHKIRRDWNNVKRMVMYEIYEHKLQQHRIVQMVLAASGDRVIEEANPDDYFWGIGSDGTGRNEIGKIWMELRERLRK